METDRVPLGFAFGEISHIYTIARKANRRQDHNNLIDDASYCEHASIAAMGDVAPLAGSLYKGRRAVFIVGNAYCSDCKTYWNGRLPTELLDRIYDSFVKVSRPFQESPEELEMFRQPKIEID